MSESSINTSKDLNELLAKLETDNKLLAELDCKLRKANNSYDSEDSVVINSERDREKTTLATTADSKHANCPQLMSTSMPSLYQSSSSFTDTSVSAGGGVGHQSVGQQTSYRTTGHSVGTGTHFSNPSSNPSNLMNAQNGKLTQQTVDRMTDRMIELADMDLDDLDLHMLDLGKRHPLKNHLLDDNDLLLNIRSSINTNISNKYTKFHSKSDGLPYHHNYDPIIKYTGASIPDKSKSLSLFQFYLEQN